MVWTMAFPDLFSKEDVQGYLRSTAESLGVEIDSDTLAAELDRRDPVAHLRTFFNIPSVGQLLAEGERSADVDPSTESVYLCGNSLGLQPKSTRTVVEDALDSWAERGVRGHYMGPNAWMPMEDSVIPGFAKLVGAKAIEVTAMNSLTVNLHLGLVPFYKPTPDRYKIVMEENPFPSDLYAVQSQVRWHGYDPDTAIVFAKAQEPGGIWRDEDVVSFIDEVGESVALVLFSGVHYSTGHFFNMKSITEAGHRKGCYVGWDLAHAVGNVEMALHDLGVDFACWCSYKYLNSGPGSVAGFFVHENHAMKPELSRLIGWWAHGRDTRFIMDNVLELEAGAKGFQVSNPPVLGLCCLQASLSVFEKTSIKQLVRKSRILTGYLELLIKDNLSTINGETSSEPHVKVVTSSVPRCRGNQLSLYFRTQAMLSEVQDYISARGVVVDVRGPLMRVAPAPLYNSFSDVLKFFCILKQALYKPYLAVP